MKEEYVLMADIIDSSSHEGEALSQMFAQLVNQVNQQFKAQIKSPLTITLGDEFQGVILDLGSAIEIIFGIEEALIMLEMPFQLRYVLNYGEIDTPVNPEIAYGMLGQGLTEARKKLTESKKGSNRFAISVESGTKTDQLNQAFYLYQYVQEGWNPKDLEVVALFLKGKTYREVAEILEKDDSSTWRREKSLGIKAYNTCKELIKSLAQ